MSFKHTYSRSITWKPDDTSTLNGQGRLLSSSGREVSYFKLSAGGGAAAMSVYDVKAAGDANPSNLVWFLDASTTDNDINPFPAPLGFKNGIYVVLEQGSGFNPVLCIGYMPDQV